MVEKTHTPVGSPDLTRKEVDDAKKEGVTDYIKEGSKNAMVADTGTTGDADEMAERLSKQVSPDLNTTFIAPLLNLSVDDLKKRFDPKQPGFVDFEHAKGLLALERAGRNRTEYVQLLCKQIGVKSPYEVTSAGPAFTNDVTAITTL